MLLLFCYVKIVEMGNVEINMPVKKIELQATITRANGKKENLGTIAHWDRSFLKRRWFNITSFLKKTTN